MDASGRLVGTRKGGMRVYMVDVFCIHIWKNNWNLLKLFSQRRNGGMMEGVNITKMCKHICKYHNISPCTTIIY
jgi:hypothetical protein